MAPLGELQEIKQKTYLKIESLCMCLYEGRVRIESSNIFQKNHFEHKMNKWNKGSRIITICYTLQTTAAGEADKDRKRNFAELS